MLTLSRPPMAARTALRRGGVSLSLCTPLRGGLVMRSTPAARGARCAASKSATAVTQQRTDKERKFIESVVGVLQRSGGSTDTGRLAAALTKAGVARPSGKFWKQLQKFSDILSVTDIRGSKTARRVTLKSPHVAPETAAPVPLAPASDSDAAAEQLKQGGTFLAGVVTALQRSGGSSETTKLGAALVNAGVARPPTGALWKQLLPFSHIVTVIRGTRKRKPVVTLVSSLPSSLLTLPAPSPPSPSAAAPAAAPAEPTPMAVQASNIIFPAAVKKAAAADAEAVPPPRASWSPTAPRCASQALYAASLSDACAAAFVVAVGPAGTGKTLLAVAAGANALLSGAASRLIITRPAVAADEDLGYLPGTAESKLQPYLVPVMDVLATVWHATSLAALQESRRLQVVPLGFMRGRTFDDAFVVADEMQNATPQQMNMLLSRLGRGSRMVITGDLAQSDRTHGGANGLAVLVQRLQAATAVAPVAAAEDASAADETKAAFSEAVRRDFALHVFDDRSVQRHPAVRTALALMGAQKEKMVQQAGTGMDTTPL